MSWQLLSQPEMTQHAVNLLGPLLLSRGCAGAAPASPFSARLRATGQPDVVVSHRDTGALVALEPDDRSPAIETDAAARLLFIWGRRPNDAARITSTLRPEDRLHLQSLLAGG